MAWLNAGDGFPDVKTAWPTDSPAPGLLAASARLDAEQLQEAYRHGIFPWFSAGQPVLWWSPDPRMVLVPSEFRFYRSLRQALRRTLSRPGVQLRFNRDFSQVIHQCARHPRPGQNGTWITPSIIDAYTALHQQGFAHSAELWDNNQLIAGLYFVAMGHAVYGESMFTHVRDGSKMALALLVSVAHHHGLPLIDCQQNTPHLRSLGGREIPRAKFMDTIALSQKAPPIAWTHEHLRFESLTS